jgi:alanyl-tRNA synthetase
LARPARPQNSEQVRQAFLDFFRSKGHLERPSASLVPSRYDPTVLLTTAGMQPMIPYMLGLTSPPAPRMVSVQKCFRTTDIDQVGNVRNLTFFEMLGNFSIGDYFKPEAIAWAREFVTGWLQLEPQRIWVTVHPTDDEAVELWLGQDIPRERIVPLAENWWGPPGAEGPCGPDSELYFDRGAELGCGRPDCLPGCDCDRYLEFWNLVFMQFFQDRAGDRTPLPRPNIDTGLGLERTTALMQNVPSVYDTDLFRPIIEAVAGLSGTAYGRAEKTDYALRVLADHGRGMTFLAGDGVSPSNEGRGYVMRRIVRRAVRFGRVLGIERPFMTDLAEHVIGRMADRYPELAAQRAAILGVLDLEERRFRETLAAGESRLAEWIEEAQSRGESTVDGRRLFLLHDTFGFPFELGAEMLAEAGLQADRAGFEQAMEQQRERSRAVSAFDSTSAGENARVTLATGDGTELPGTEFLGYETLRSEAEVVGVQFDGPAADELSEGQPGVLILDRTPFYPEGGGQVGDRGYIRMLEGLFQVEDTQDDEAGHILHRGKLVAGVARPGAVVQAEVDRAWRSETTRHHSLTHILHQSLRDVLGPSTQQRGSLVAPGVARFDFNYGGPLSESQRRDLQDLINGRVLEDHEIRWRVMPLDEARESGALMIFGEKYGDAVRVVSIGDFSRELCGGTHVERSAEVGPAVILRETGIGSGLRRVEVVAGQAGLDHIYRRLADVQQIAGRLNVPVDQARRRVDELLDQLDQARREVQRLSSQLASRQASELANRMSQVEGVSVLASRVETGTPQALVEQWDALRARLKSGVVFLAATVSGSDRTSLLVGVTPDLRTRGLDAGALMRRFAERAGGKGGGSPTLAKGAGTDPALLGPALEAAPDLVRDALRRS